MAEDQDRGSALVEALVIADRGALALAKSLLEQAAIPFFVKNERAQNLFGLGELGPGYNLIVGPPVVMVAASEADTARELLVPLVGQSAPPSEDEQEA